MEARTVLPSHISVSIDRRGNALDCLAGRARASSGWRQSYDSGGTRRGAPSADQHGLSDTSEKSPMTAPAMLVEDSLKIGQKHPNIETYVGRIEAHVAFQKRIDFIEKL